MFPSRTAQLRPWTWLLLITGCALVIGSSAALVERTVLDALVGLVERVTGRPVLPAAERVIRRALADVLLAGCLMAGAGALLRRPDVLRSVSARGPLRVGITIALAALLQGMLAWFRSSALVDGSRVWFLHDDAMISMRYAANLAAGEGLAWNVGERVEGYSNFLWTCLMGLFHRIGVPQDHASLLVLLTNIVLSFALLVQLDRLATAFRMPAAICMLTLLLATLSREMLLWSLSGLETIALAALCTCAFAHLLQRSPHLTAPGLLIAVALLPLVRADGIVIAALITIAALAIHRNARQAAWLAAAAAAPYAVHMGWRLFYYREWLPNTAYLKVASMGRSAAGATYLLDFARSHAAVLALAAVALWSMPRRVGLPLAGLLTAYGAYVLYIGGDAFAGARFLVPVLPLLFVLAALGTTVPSSSAWRRAAVASLLAATPLLLPNRWLPFAPALFPALAPSYADVGNVVLGRWLRANTSPQATVGDYWAGSVFYFSGRRGVDFLGKSDKTIARTTPVCQNGIPGHDKFDFSHSLTRLQPDFVVAGFKLTAEGTAIGPSGERMPDDDRSRCRFLGALLEHPEFRACYLPHIAGNDGWRTIFRRGPPCAVRPPALDGR